MLVLFLHWHFQQLSHDAVWTRLSRGCQHRKLQCVHDFHIKEEFLSIGLSWKDELGRCFHTEPKHPFICSTEADTKAASLLVFSSLKASKLTQTHCYQPAQAKSLLNLYFQDINSRERTTACQMRHMRVKTAMKINAERQSYLRSDKTLRNNQAGTERTAQCSCNHPVLLFYVQLSKPSSWRHNVAHFLDFLSCFLKFWELV